MALVFRFGVPRLLSMKSANALLCVPRGDGELAAGQQLPAILIADIPPPSAAECYHAKVRIMVVCFACLLFVATLHCESVVLFRNLFVEERCAC